MNDYTAHVDTFARDRLPPRELRPEFRFDLPELRYPNRINCGQVLLDDVIATGQGHRTAIYSAAASWTYEELAEQTNRIANVLVNQMGVVPGNRVLMRAANSPMLVATWLAVMKVGAIAVTTMPMLRAKELSVIVQRAAIRHALCDAILAGELAQAAAHTKQLDQIACWGNGELESMMLRERPTFTAIDTARDDVCLLAFTSGTTGNPKATMHFHRDVLAMADTVGRHLLQSGPGDIYVGSPCAPQLFHPNHRFRGGSNTCRPQLSQPDRSWPSRSCLHARQ